METRFTIRQSCIAKEMRIKRLIAGYKEESKKTWDDIANLCGMSRQLFLYHWNHGSIDLWMYLAIFRFLNIPLSELQDAMREG